MRDRVRIEAAIQQEKIGFEFDKCRLLIFGPNHLTYHLGPFGKK